MIRSRYRKITTVLLAVITISTLKVVVSDENFSQLFLHMGAFDERFYRQDEVLASIRYGDIDRLRSAINNGADVNRVYAVPFDSDRKLMDIAIGIDPRVEAKFRGQNKSHTPLTAVLESTRKYSLDTDTGYAMIGLLLEAGADPHTKTLEIGQEMILPLLGPMGEVFGPGLMMAPSSGEKLLASAIESCEFALANTEAMQVRAFNKSARKKPGLAVKKAQKATTFAMARIRNW